MPYGLPGGRDKDKKLMKWMENCVARVKAQGHDEGSAIAICKTVLKKKNYNLSEASDRIILILNPDIFKKKEQ
jgi:hypothetical protein